METLYNYMYILHVFELTIFFLQPIFTYTNLIESKFIYIDMFYSTDKKGEML